LENPRRHPAAFHAAVFDKFKPEGQYQELLAESADEGYCPAAARP